MKTSIIRRFLLGAALVLLGCCTTVFAHQVSVYLNCNDGSVTAHAYAMPSYSFGYGEMDLEITGPATSYRSTSGIGGLNITETVGFEYDAYYTAVACAYFEDDDGSWFGCDTYTCVTPIQPTE
jgi:hypothetical protein